MQWQTTVADALRQISSYFCLPLLQVSGFYFLFFTSSKQLLLFDFISSRQLLQFDFISCRQLLLFAFARQRGRWIKSFHRALCCLFRPDTDGMRVSKCGQLFQQTRRLDSMLFQCWYGDVVGQYWNSIGSNARVCWAPHRCLSTPTPPPP